MGWLDILLPIALGLGGTPDVAGAWRTPRIVLAGDGYHCLAENVVVLIELEAEQGLGGQYWAEVRCSYLGAVLYQEKRNGVIEGVMRADGSLEFTVEGGPVYRGRVLGNSLQANGNWEVNGVHLRGRIEAIRPAEHRGATLRMRAQTGTSGGNPPR
ncbi:MAG: hypothetical protein R3E10_10770 [Gemmatimonadota bacterium]